MNVLNHNYVEDTNPCLEASYNEQVCNTCTTVHCNFNKDYIWIMLG